MSVDDPKLLTKSKIEYCEHDIHSPVIIINWVYLFIFKAISAFFARWNSYFMTVGLFEENNLYLFHSGQFGLWMNSNRVHF